MDPSTIASGMWYSIHLEAFEAKTEDEKRAFLRTMKRFCEKYPCAKCRRHASEYIAKHPIEKYWNTNKGIFKWSWIFHNDVNERLGKPLISWDDAYAIYSGEENIHVCTEGCDDNSKSRSQHSQSLSHRSQESTKWALPPNAVVRKLQPSEVTYLRPKIISKRR